METATVHDALRYLARRCDYAGQRDAAGYNKIDTQCHDCAAVLPNLLDGALALAAGKTADEKEGGAHHA